VEKRKTYTDFESLTPPDIKEEGMERGFEAAKGESEGHPCEKKRKWPVKSMIVHLFPGKGVSKDGKVN